MQSPFASHAFNYIDEQNEPFVDERIRMLLTHVPDAHGREVVRVNLCVVERTTRQYSFVSALTRPVRLDKTASISLGQTLTVCDRPAPHRNTSATPSVWLDQPRKSVCTHGARFHPVKCVVQYPKGTFVPRGSMKRRLDLL